MGKYNEIMKHIEVTAEMQDRILSNIDRHFRKKRERMYNWIPFAGMAAAAAIVVMVISPWNNSPIVQDVQQPYDTSGFYGEEEYGSAAELSAAVGFEVRELSNVPFDITETRYSAPDEGFAQIDYIGGDEILTFRKSVGTGDNSGDYNEYADEKDVVIGGLTVTMKGEDGRICLAAWTDGTYAYSVDDVSGVVEDAMLRMLEELTA